MCPCHLPMPSALHAANSCMREETVAVGKLVYRVHIFKCLQEHYISGPQFQFFWNTSPDIQGGLTMLMSVFQEFAMRNIRCGMDQCLSTLATR
jgi:hypothetical protein